MSSPQDALSAAREDFNAGNLEHYLRLYDDGIRLHGLAPEPLGKAEVRGFYEQFFAAFADLRLEFDEVLWSGDAATIRFTITGRHVGEYMGVPAGGADVVIPGITVMRFTGDRVSERWTSADLLGLMQQIGAMPAPSR
jgi:predicted ester cyclase